MGAVSQNVRNRAQSRQTRLLIESKKSRMGAAQTDVCITAADAHTQPELVPSRIGAGKKLDSSIQVVVKGLRAWYDCTNPHVTIHIQEFSLYGDL